MDHLLARRALIDAARAVGEVLRQSVSTWFCDANLFDQPIICDAVYVAGGDVTGDGKAEVITGTNNWGGPVRVFQIDAAVIELTSFAPYFSRFVGPVRVAAADPSGERHRMHVGCAASIGCWSVTNGRRLFAVDVDIKEMGVAHGAARPPIERTLARAPPIASIPVPGVWRAPESLLLMDTHSLHDTLTATRPEDEPGAGPVRTVRTGHRSSRSPPAHALSGRPRPAISSQSRSSSI
jgi:hypothetical protein